MPIPGLRAVWLCERGPILGARCPPGGRPSAPNGKAPRKAIEQPTRALAVMVLRAAPWGYSPPPCRKRATAPRLANSPAA